MNNKLLAVVPLALAASVMMSIRPDARAETEARPGTVMDPYIGQIMLFGGNFAPRGFAKCDGTLLAISSHQALFSILGTTYGGDGRTTFALPDLRGRTPIHWGTGRGLSEVRFGAKGGSETTTLTVANLPSHTHDVAPSCNETSADQTKPGGNYPSVIDMGGTLGKGYSVTSDQTMGATTSTAAGGGQSIDNRPPFQAVTYCIALEGVFPPRN